MKYLLMGKILKSTYIVICLLLFGACAEKKDTGIDCNLVDCMPAQAITLNITTSDGKPVLLDEYYTFIDSRTRFTSDSQTTELLPGYYFVVTGGELEYIEEDGTILIFVGVIDGKNVVEHQMVVNKDCCNPYLIQGDSSIIVD